MVLYHTQVNDALPWALLIHVSFTFWMFSANVLPSEDITDAFDEVFFF